MKNFKETMEARINTINLPDTLGASLLEKDKELHLTMTMLGWEGRIAITGFGIHIHVLKRGKVISSTMNKELRPETNSDIDTVRSIEDQLNKYINKILDKDEDFFTNAINDIHKFLDK